MSFEKNYKNLFVYYFFTNRLTSIDVVVHEQQIGPPIFRTVILVSIRDGSILQASIPGSLEEYHEGVNGDNAKNEFKFEAISSKTKLKELSPYQPIDDPVQQVRQLKLRMGLDVVEEINCEHDSTNHEEQLHGVRVAGHGDREPPALELLLELFGILERDPDHRDRSVAEQYCEHGQHASAVQEEQILARSGVEGAQLLKVLGQREGPDDQGVFERQLFGVKNRAHDYQGQ